MTAGGLGPTFGFPTEAQRAGSFGGTIQVRSEPGRGATFIVELPLHAGPAKHPP